MMNPFDLSGKAALVTGGNGGIGLGMARGLARAGAAVAPAAYPHMKRAGGGKKALATAWAKDNIQVNAVLPGWIDTALTRPEISPGSACAGAATHSAITSESRAPALWARSAWG